MSSDGQEGRLRYLLVTDNQVPELELTDALLVAGHQQRLAISLTAAGHEHVSTPERIQHTVLPSEGITLVQQQPAGSSPPSLHILATTPGLYTVESHLGGELVDRINLTFDNPDRLELATFVRAPWAADFVPATGEPVAVEEGAQVTMQASPRNAEGRRLAGDLQTELTVSPEWAVVPGAGVIHADEDGVWQIHGDLDFYFIAPALVGFTVVDPVSGAMSTQSFEVAPTEATLRLPPETL